jgi:hypothetical protein
MPGIRPAVILDYSPLWLPLIMPPVATDLVLARNFVLGVPELPPEAGEEEVALPTEQIEREC